MSVKNFYKLRIDLETVAMAIVIEYVNKWSNRYCYVREKMDTNPHVHFYIETETKEATIRNQIRLKLNLTGNGKYSLKATEERPIAYIAYMMKEGEVKYVNMDEATIEEATEYNEKVVEEMKIKKENKKTIIQQVEEWFKVQEVDLEMLYRMTKYEVIYSRLLDYHQEKEIMVRTQQIINIFNTLGIRNDRSGILRNKIIDKMICFG